MVWLLKFFLMDENDLAILQSIMAVDGLEMQSQASVSIVIT